MFRTGLMSGWIVVGCLLMAGCGADAPIVSAETLVGVPASGKMDGVVGVYPVDPAVHGAMEPEVLNAIAYARYAAEIVTPLPLGQAGVDGDVAVAVATRWAEVAAAGPVSASEAASFAVVEADEWRRAALVERLYGHAEGAPAFPELSKQQARLADLSAGRDACVAHGYSEADCCVALGYYAALLRRDDIDAVGAPGDDFWHAWVEQRLAETSQPFVHLGIKAWLSACGPWLDDAPRDLEGMRRRIGDWTGPGWDRELHPASLAKRSGRRIYRRTLPDGAHIAVAESLSASCEVRETEVIVALPGRALRFYTFDHAAEIAPHGYFLARLGVDAVKLSPDACMGCHYTFDTRRFSVVAPSFEALNLTYTVRGGVPQWRDDVHCAEPGDTIVRHDALTVTRP